MESFFLIAKVREKEDKYLKWEDMVGWLGWCGASIFFFSFEIELIEKREENGEREELREEPKSCCAFVSKVWVYGTRVREEVRESERTHTQYSPGSFEEL